MAAATSSSLLVGQPAGLEVEFGLALHPQNLSPQVRKAIVARHDLRSDRSRAPEAPSRQRHRHRYPTLLDSVFVKPASLSKWSTARRCGWCTRRSPFLTSRLMVFWMSTASTPSKSPDWTRGSIGQALRTRLGAPSSTPPRDLSLGAALGSRTRAFCAASKPQPWGRCRALGFDCSGEGPKARQLIDSAALLGERIRAKRLASDLELIASRGSLPVQPGISGPGHERSVLGLDWPPACGRSQAVTCRVPVKVELNFAILCRTEDC